MYYWKQLFSVGTKQRFLQLFQFLKKNNFLSHSHYVLFFPEEDLTNQSNTRKNHIITIRRYMYLICKSFEIYNVIEGYGCFCNHCSPSKCSCSNKVCSFRCYQFSDFKNVRLFKKFFSCTYTGKQSYIWKIVTSRFYFLFSSHFCFFVLFI